MSESTLLWLIWIVLQVSLVGLIAALLPLACGRLSPVVRGRIALAGLVGMSAILLIGLMPGAGWISLLSPTNAIEKSQRTDSPVEGATPPAPSEVPDVIASPAAPGGIDLATNWRSLTGWFTADEATPPLETELLAKRNDLPAGNHPSIGLRSFFYCLIAAEAIALARILAGFWGVMRLRRKAIACQLPRVNQTLRRLIRQSGAGDVVLLAISPEIESPAVVGWRRFMILLPPDYRDWSQEQLRTVLAHELAHIVRRDSRWRTVAVLLQALHFYNPLAHFLSRRYALEQELGADQLACVWLGDRQTYWQGLAQLALQKSAQTPAWARLAFLPSRSTLIRRLEMLRSAPLPISPILEKTYQAGAISLLFMLTIAIGGLRPLAGQTPPSDQQRQLAYPDGFQRATRLAELAPAEFGHFAVETNVEQILKDPQIAKFLRKKVVDVPADGEGPTLGDMLRRDWTLPPEQIAAMLWINTTNPPFALSPDQPPQVDALLILAKTDIDFNALGVNYDAESRYVATPTFSGNHDLYLPLATNAVAVSSSKETLEWLNAYQQQAADQRKTLASVMPPSDAAVVVTCNVQSLLPSLRKSPPTAAYMAMLNPALEPATRWRLEIRRSESQAKLAGRLTMNFKSPSAAEAALPTIESIRVLVKNMLDSASDSTPHEEKAFDVSRANAVQAMLAIGKESLDSLKIEIRGAQGVATGSASLTTQTVTQLLAPALVGARLAEQRSIDMHNMKRIVLAFHNYYTAYGHFPLAVMTDEESDEKRSWRVELLPFLGHQALYDRYRKDLPWDSVENLVVLAQMPEVYESSRLPIQPDTVKAPSGGMQRQIEPTAMTTSYHVVTGKGTSLSLPSKARSGFGMEAGDAAAPSVAFPRFQDFTDGTSNTILVVQSNVKIPWTKPEDLPIESAGIERLKPVHDDAVILAGYCDGSVRVISKLVDPDIWKHLLLRDDGQIIPEF
ncbi:MAG: M56 family metallopeptidase [Blastopirellula sp. JB062]